MGLEESGKPRAIDDALDMHLPPRRYMRFSASIASGQNQVGL